MMPAATGPTTHATGLCNKLEHGAFYTAQMGGFQMKYLIWIGKTWRVLLLLLVSTFLTETCSVNVCIHAEEVTLNFTKLEISSAGGDHA